MFLFQKESFLYFYLFQRERNQIECLYEEEGITKTVDCRFPGRITCGSIYLFFPLTKYEPSLKRVVEIRNIIALIMVYALCCLILKVKIMASCLRMPFIFIYAGICRYREVCITIRVKMLVNIRFMFFLYGSGC